MTSLLIKRLIIAFIILGTILLVYYSRHLHRTYKRDAEKELTRTNTIESDVVTEQDLADLPEPVQEYLRYVGVVGKEKVKNFRLTIDGNMKTDRDKDWAPVKVKQISSTDEMTRFFYLEMKMKGLPIYGLHAYKDGKAIMKIKLGGLIPVVDSKGDHMNQAETVTVFNDMCLAAPATLIDDRIEWETIDDQTVKATFTNEGISVSATLYFNDQGQLTNFVSHDRYFSPEGKTFKSIPWSTPISDFKEMNGYMLPTYGEAIWSFEDEEFSYARFNIRNIEYNVETVE
ncbi:DUF6544 family protein [Haloplasma contractile]|uniref:Uncharacterized protein n=1 Tax=Haloplasma contractile SSD-17B TaxID=1033810 RepID=F7Q236_9MOLU|nr:DUF6544 family protein [Haloplasma contractile]ERJ12157.1 hypothetical protein HLPCO_001684 [Haloplasma contractile SSD-17B]